MHAVLVSPSFIPQNDSVLVHTYDGEKKLNLELWAEDADKVLSCL